jgi:acylphosphatase
MFILVEEFSFHVLVWGTVQGIGFREFVLQKALELDVSGYVRNLPSQNAIEVVASGFRENLIQFSACLHEGPPAATVIKVDQIWSALALGVKGFTRLD